MSTMTKALVGAVLAGLAVLAGATEVGGLDALTVHAHLVAAVAALTAFNGVYFSVNSVPAKPVEVEQAADVYDLEG